MGDGKRSEPRSGLQAACPPHATASCLCTREGRRKTAAGPVAGLTPSATCTVTHSGDRHWALNVSQEPGRQQSRWKKASSAVRSTTPEPAKAHRAQTRDRHPGMQARGDHLERPATCGREPISTLIPGGRARHTAWPGQRHTPGRHNSTGVQLGPHVSPKCRAAHPGPRAFPPSHTSPDPQGERPAQRPSPAYVRAPRSCLPSRRLSETRKEVKPQVKGTGQASLATHDQSRSPLPLRTRGRASARKGEEHVGNTAGLGQSPAIPGVPKQTGRAACLCSPSCE